MKKLWILVGFVLLAWGQVAHADSDTATPNTDASNNAAWQPADINRARPNVSAPNTANPNTDGSNNAAWQPAKPNTDASNNATWQPANSNVAKPNTD